MPWDHDAREDDGTLDLACSGAFATFASLECWLASSCKPAEPLAIIVFPSILL